MGKATAYRTGHRARYLRALRFRSSCYSEIAASLLKSCRNAIAEAEGEPTRSCSATREKLQKCNRREPSEGTPSTVWAVGVIGSDGANNDDDGQAVGDLLDEVAAHAVKGPSHLWCGVIDDTRYGAWARQAVPWCYGRVHEMDECPRGKTGSWAGPWPIGRETRHVTRQHFGCGTQCTVCCKPYE